MPPTGWMRETATTAASLRASAIPRRAIEDHHWGHSCLVDAWVAARAIGTDPGGCYFGKKGISRTDAATIDAAIDLSAARVE